MKHCGFRKNASIQLAALACAVLFARGGSAPAAAQATDAAGNALRHSVKPNLPSKKLIEYGWDMPSPQYLRDNIREMEKQPFDGVMFRLSEPAGEVFKPEAWDEKKLAPQLKVLSEIKWNKFTDNFLAVYAASSMDWFSDADWEKVLAHTKFMARAAKTANCKGILFDPEPYGNNPWLFDEQKHSKTKTYEEYAAQARKRGNQFMRAMASEMPTMKLLMFYQYSMFHNVSHDNDPVKRAQSVNSYNYALMAPFLDGMLEAAGPGVEFIDGNEFSYYYTSALEFFRAYQVMHHGAKLYVAPELREKFDRQVRAAHALYADYVFSLRPNIYKSTLAVNLTPEERAQWFEHNVYYGLQATDEYVWLYSEKMDWWKQKELPPGITEAVLSAKRKIANGDPLGADMEETIRKGQARLAAAIEAKLLRRTARIAKITAAQKPTIDGQLNEATYTQITPLDAFVPYVNPYGDPAELKGPTRAWVTYDDENLYLAFRNSEPQMAKLQAVGNSRDSQIWGGDSVEISIHPDPQKNSIIHFILGPGNIQWDALDREKISDMSFNPKWQSAVARGTDEWTVEAAIPWRELNIEPPKPGTTLRANLARQRIAGENAAEMSSWSQFISGFQEPKNFGTWTFE